MDTFEFSRIKFIKFLGLCNPRTLETVKYGVEKILPAPKRYPWQSIFSILVALLYDGSPIDLIPDLIPILGWLDDGVVTVLMIVFAIASFRKWAKAKRSQPAIIEARSR